MKRSTVSRFQVVKLLAHNGPRQSKQVGFSQTGSLAKEQHFLHTKKSQQENLLAVTANYLLFLTNN